MWCCVDDLSFKWCFFQSFQLQSILVSCCCCVGARVYQNSGLREIVRSCMGADAWPVCEGQDYDEHGISAFGIFRSGTWNWFWTDSLIPPFYCFIVFFLALFIDFRFTFASLVCNPSVNRHFSCVTWVFANRCFFRFNLVGEVMVVGKSLVSCCRKNVLFMK